MLDQSDKNGFERHCITHSSPSSINMFADAPCAWVAKYLHKKSFPFGPAPAAGIATEKVVVSVLLGSSFEDAMKDALAYFNRKFAFDRSDKVINAMNGFSYMAASMLRELGQYGEPEFGPNGEQLKLSIDCKGDGWTLPVIGFIDLFFPKHDLIVDLKTTSRMPSEMSKSHQRQSATYEKAFAKEVRFLYATPKKVQWLRHEGVDETMSEIKAILNRQERFLRLGNKEEIASVVPVIDNFYWSGAEGIRKELYGL